MALHGWGCGVTSRVPGSRPDSFASFIAHLIGTMDDDTALSPEGRLNRIFLDRYRELLEGIPEGEPTWITSGGPGGGLYGTLEVLTAGQASQAFGGTSIVAHTEHVRWAIAMVNEVFRGNAPEAAWSESWRVTQMNDAAWRELRDRLREEGTLLLRNIGSAHRWDDEAAINGALASLAHTAYHLGAIRQLQRRITQV